MKIVVGVRCRDTGLTIKVRPGDKNLKHLQFNTLSKNGERVLLLCGFMGAGAHLTSMSG